MPLLILDITCETWKIIILNFGFMVLTGNWPQTKALIIWGLTRKQEVGRLPADNKEWEEGGNRTTWLQLGPGEVDGNTHESGRALSQLLAQLVAYVRILEASQEFLTFRVFGSLAMTISNSSLTITKKVVAFITFSHKNFKDTAYCARCLTK